MRISLRYKISTSRQQNTTSPAQIINHFNPTRPRPTISIRPIMRPLTTRRRQHNRQRINIRATRLIREGRPIKRRLQPSPRSPTANREKRGDIQGHTSARLRNHSVKSLTMSPSNSNLNRLIKFTELRQRRQLIRLSRMISVISIRRNVTMNIQRTKINLHSRRPPAITRHLRRQQRSISLRARQRRPIAQNQNIRRRRIRQ